MGKKFWSIDRYINKDYNNGLYDDSREGEFALGDFNMVWGRLSGYRRIDEICDHDVEDEPGVYLFYKRIDGPVRYVGRSDTSLYNRISGREYLYYRYKHCQDDDEAYYWECEYFHRYEDTIENWNHPAIPWYSNLQCHICGI